MSSYQQVTILGNVGRDPDVKYGANGNAVVNVSVATSRKWKDKNDERHEETEWHRITFFGRSAEIIGEYVRKGNRLFVTGYLKTRKWTDKDGIEKYTTEIIGEQFQLLDRNDDADSEPAPRASKPASKPQRAPAPDDGDDDIPF
jgi:single-strand DNA-binding protein